MDPLFIEGLPFYEYQIWLSKINKSVEMKSQRADEENGMKQVFSFRNSS
jgi:hypothetical protein